MHGDENKKRHHLLPIMVDIIPEVYTTVVCDLTKPLDKKQRKAIRYAKNKGHVALRVYWQDACRWAVTKKGLDPTRMLNLFRMHAASGSEFYLCYERGMDAYHDREPVGGLNIMTGTEWITEFIAWGEQDAIKGKVIEEFSKRGYHYYDLAGVGGRDSINKYKLKWGEVREVRLR